MNIKSIAGDAQRPASERDEKKKKTSPNEADTAATPQAQTLSAEAGDESLRAMQPVDSQTVAELLALPTPSPTAKFPTRPPGTPPPASVKKLNRSA